MKTSKNRIRFSELTYEIINDKFIVPKKKKRRMGVDVYQEAYDKNGNFLKNIISHREIIEFEFGGIDWINYIKDRFNGCPYEHLNRQQGILIYNFKPYGFIFEKNDFITHRQFTDECVFLIDNNSEYYYDGEQDYGCYQLTRGVYYSIPSFMLFNYNLEKLKNDYIELYEEMFPNFKDLKSKMDVYDTYVNQIKRQRKMLYNQDHVTFMYNLINKQSKNLKLWD